MSNNKPFYRQFKVGFSSVFLFGFVTGVAVTMLFAFFQLKSVIPAAGTVITKDSSQDVIDSNEVSSIDTLKVYNTDIKDWTVTATDGTVAQFKTPVEYSSLTDQYLDTLSSSYNTEINIDNIVCVGNAGTQQQATVLITASPLSCITSLLETIYAGQEDVDLSTFTYSEAYTYMTTGSIGEDVEGVEVIEEESITSTAGLEFKVYRTERDTVYYTDDSKTETTTIHSTELTAYSTNEDAIEVLVYMQEYDDDAARKVMSEFIN